MNISVKPGVYVVAVSGGVDSMALLDVLAHTPGVELTVAHFNHGMRSDASVDEELVRRAALVYKLPYRNGRGNLGAGASEATARNARYAFLRDVQQEVGAQAIITAHHQDDTVETAIINIVRGTGRKGLSSLASNESTVRPLLAFPKRYIVEYAHANQLVWNEDSTNKNDVYARNHIRHHIVPRLGETGRRRLLQCIERAQHLNDVIENDLSVVLQQGAPHGVLNRRWFILLPYEVSTEVMAAWLRQHGIREFNKKTITRLTVQAKVAQAGKIVDINAGYLLKVEKATCRITEVATLKTD